MYKVEFRWRNVGTGGFGMPCLDVVHTIFRKIKYTFGKGDLVSVVSLLVFCCLFYYQQHDHPAHTLPISTLWQHVFKFRTDKSTLRDTHMAFNVSLPNNAYLTVFQINSLWDHNGDRYFLSFLFTLSPNSFPHKTSFHLPQLTFLYKHENCIQFS